MGAHALTQESQKVFPIPRVIKSQSVGRRVPSTDYGYELFTNYGPYDAIEVSGTSTVAIIGQKSAAPAHSVSEKVQQIESHLGLNRSQTAAALRVTRKTVYDWLNKGAILSDSRTDARLQKLFKIAGEQTDKAMGKYYGVNLQRPVINEKSLLDILTDEAIDEEKARAALEIVAELAAESKQRMEAFAKKQPKRLPSHEAQATLDGLAPRT